MSTDVKTDIELASLRAELHEAREEADLNRLQLQLVEEELEFRDETELDQLQLLQVQEELEFLLQAHEQLQKLLEGYRLEAQRAEGLIAALLEQLEARG